MTPITRRQWLAALAQASTVTADKVPDGWLCAKQLAELWDRDRSHAKHIAGILVSKGKAEIKPFRINTGQRVTSVVHYHLK
jgi:hypothetical protein